MFTVTRSIGIDAGHRIPEHASKCKHLHGHRYTIQATCLAEKLISKGEQTGMVTDFGFLKDVMMAHIDAPCDHGFIIWYNDPYLKVFRDYLPATKLYVLDCVPTAENLAKHWFEHMENDVKTISKGQASLVKVTVWETPNCHATYEPD